MPAVGRGWAEGTGHSGPGGVWTEEQGWGAQGWHWARPQNGSFWSSWGAQAHPARPELVLLFLKHQRYLQACSPWGWHELFGPKPPCTSVPCVFLVRLGTQGHSGMVICNPQPCLCSAETCHSKTMLNRVLVPAQTRHGSSSLSRGQ